MSTSFRESTALLSTPATELTFRAVLELVKLTNIVFAIIAGSLQFYYGYSNASIEYVQICFLAIIVSVIDSEPGCARYCLFGLHLLVGLAWTAGAVYFATWGMPVIASVLIAIDNISYTTGALACAIVIINRPPTKEIPKVTFIDLDLIVYLVALNLLCINPINSFNLGLHMILDIRLMVLLFVGLYRPADKIQLLHDKSFVAALISIVAFFLIYKAGTDYVTHSIAFLVNTVLGVVLHWQAYYHYTVVHPAMRNQSNSMASKEDELV
ncbi:hypothetical protein EON65_58690 [archaeon]|nr:MAG: hypothetical protein EON65_58690 [archaeon]